MKILFQRNGSSGVFYHRQFIPHVVMTEIIKGITVDDTADILKMDDDKIMSYDIIVLHGRINLRLLQKLAFLKKKFVYDVDDYWHCTPDRIFYNEWKVLEHAYWTELAISEAALVTCTSDILANYIKKHTKVTAHVLPNGIAENDPQFTPVEIKSDILRFGFIGGSSHILDIPIVGNAITKLFYDYPEYRSKWQIVFGGFDTLAIAQSQDGIKQSFRQKDLPSVNIEKWLTNDYRILEIDQIEELKKYSGESVLIDRQYRRLWTKNVHEYAKMINLIDISLCPLSDNTFNRCKSNLKVIEAGWMGKEVIASDIGTFKDGKTDSNLMLCDSEEEWLGAMLSDIENFIATGQPIRSELHSLVHEHYNAKNFAEKRYELYKTLM